MTDNATMKTFYGEKMAKVKKKTATAKKTKKSCKTKK
jgi:hypothetical protein